MAENLVINGVTYPGVSTLEMNNANGEKVMFYPDAVRYNPQTLTEAQKAQARENIGAIDETKLAEELAKRGQLAPEYANSIEECTDTSKLYVLPDGFIYAYKTITTEGGTEEVTERITGEFLDDTRLSTSNGGTKTATGFVTSPFIDVSNFPAGAKTKLTGILWAYDYDTTKDGYAFVLAKADSSVAVANFLYSMELPYYNLTIDVIDIDKTAGTSTVEIYPTDGTVFKNFTQFRFCGSGTSADTVIEVIYETTTESETKTEWGNTGHAFVPADYEPQILALENDVKTLKTKVKALEDTVLYGDSIPDYVLTEAEEVADKVLAVRNADSFVMALASDFHTNGSDTSSVSVLHAGQGMNAINSMTQLDLVALLGDYEIYGFSYGDADTDREDARKSFKHIKKAFSSVSKGVPFMQLQGNHDELPADTTEEARQKYYAYIGANNVGTVTDYNNKFRNYGYRDFENYKIRVIYLNTTDVSDSSVTGSCYVSTEQLNWLNTVALNLTDSEWGIIVLSHHPLNWYGMGNLLNALDEYKGKGEGAELIAHFHGHLHNFRAETLGTNSIPTITIPNACFGRNNEYGTSSSYSDDVKTAYGDTDENGNQRQFNKTESTAEDTAFNVIVVNTQNRKIHCFNYGAGVDREISY